MGGDVTSVKWVTLTTITQLMNSDLFPCRPSLLYTDLVPNVYLLASIPRFPPPTRGKSWYQLDTGCIGSTEFRNSRANCSRLSVAHTLR